MNFVLDASVALRWVLASGPELDAAAIMERVATDPGRFAVPELFAFETFAVVSRLHSDPEGAWLSAIQPVLVSGILRYPMTEQMASCAIPFVRKGLSGYDATYASLARMVDGLWLTYDKAAHRRVAEEGVSFLLGSGVPQSL